MIPFPENTVVNLAEDTYFQPSYTYRLDLDKKRIVGHVDAMDAIRQAVFKIMLTERYAYLIYDYTYGVELEEFIGKSFEYVAADIDRACREALLEDDRVISVDEFNLSKTGLNSLQVTFMVQTVEGTYLTSWEVIT